MVVDRNTHNRWANSDNFFGNVSCTKSTTKVKQQYSDQKFSQAMLGPRHGGDGKVHQLEALLPVLVVGVDLEEHAVHGCLQGQVVLALI